MVYMSIRWLTMDGSPLMSWGYTNWLNDTNNETEGEHMNKKNYCWEGGPLTGCASSFKGIFLKLSSRDSVCNLLPYA